jgi:hypothetical protein
LKNGYWNLPRFDIDPCHEADHHKYLFYIEGCKVYRA